MSNRLTREVIRERVMGSLDLLMDPENSVGVVAEKVEVPASTYSRVFKEIYGVSPGSWKSANEQTQAEIADKVHMENNNERSDTLRDIEARYPGVKLNMMINHVHEAARTVSMGREYRGYFPDTSDILDKDTYDKCFNDLFKYYYGCTLEAFGARFKHTTRPQNNPFQPPHPHYSWNHPGIPPYPGGGYQQSAFGRQPMPPNMTMFSSPHRVDVVTDLMNLIERLLVTHSFPLTTSDFRRVMESEFDLPADVLSSMFENRYNVSIAEYYHNRHKLNKHHNNNPPQPAKSALSVALLKVNEGGNVNGLKIPLVVNEKYGYLAVVNLDAIGISERNPIDFMKSQHRDLFNEIVVQKLKTYYHGRLDIAYLETVE